MGERKELFWRGVEGVEYIYHGEWSDPELLHDGKFANCIEVEEIMWGRFREACLNEGYDVELKEGESKFDRFCQDHAEEVYELISMFSKKN